MATYYVRKTGSDAAAGTSAGAAWLTIGKALGAAGIASGDTVYIGAGTYRQAVTVAMTSATATTSVIGDVTGANTGDAGEVIWTCYATNDKTAPASAEALTLAGRDFLSFENLTIVGGVNADTTNSVNISFTRCSFIPVSGTTSQIRLTNLADIASNWTFDSCRSFGPYSGSQVFIIFTFINSAVAEYDSNIVITNCAFVAVSGNALIQLNTSGAGTFKAGGIHITNCLLAGPQAVRGSGAGGTGTAASQVYNCVLLASTGINVTTLTSWIEDYNVFMCTTPRTNVNVGANSFSGSPYPYAMMLEFGQELVAGKNTRPFLMPSADSPVLGFGASGSGPTITTDILGVTRPAGGASASKAVGALERSNTWAKEVSTVRTGTNALSITGPGVQDFVLPVNATSTTVYVYMRYDGTYAGTKPQIQVLNGEEYGVTAATSSAVTTVDTWEELSLTFTPTAKGIVTIRLLSSDTNGGGKAFADDFTTGG